MNTTSRMALTVLCSLVLVSSVSAKTTSPVAYGIDNQGLLVKILPEWKQSFVIENFPYTNPNGLAFSNAYAGDGMLYFWESDSSTSARFLQYDISTRTRVQVTTSGTVAPGLKTNGTWGRNGDYFYIEDGTNRLVRLTVDEANHTYSYLSGNRKTISGTGSLVMGDISFDDATGILYGSAVLNGSGFFFRCNPYASGSTIAATQIASINQHQITEADNSSYLYGTQVTGANETTLRLIRKSDGAFAATSFPIEALLRDITFAGQQVVPEPTTGGLALLGLASLLGLTRRKQQP